MSIQRRPLERPAFFAQRDVCRKHFLSESFFVKNDVPFSGILFEMWREIDIILQIRPISADSLNQGVKMDQLPDYMETVLWLALLFSLYANVRLFTAKILPRLNPPKGQGRKGK